MIVFLIIAQVALLVSGAYFVFGRSKTLLTYFQQEEYDPLRFGPTVLRVRLFDVKATLFAILLLVVGLLFDGKTLFIILAACGLTTITYFEMRYNYKKKLVLTERAERILWLSVAICIVVTLIAYSASPILAVLALQFPPLALIASNSLLQPYQNHINQKYVRLAKNKLERHDPIRIGITGSFGKTTVKHIFAELLTSSGPVLYSPGSINTKLGLTRHLRRRLQWSHRYVIAEMGAYGVGSIDRLCDFVEPNYGIITSVGAAHIERFGSTETVAVAKSELARRVCLNGGTTVLNSQVLQFSPFKELRERYPNQIVTVGTTSEDDVQIQSAEVIGGDWHILIVFNYQGKKSLNYVLPLLGRHNIINSALAVALLNIIDADALKNLSYFAGSVQQIPHRLQKRDIPGQALVLDDAFNSNETGFMNAVEVLETLANERGGKSILVTPGLAELGFEHEDIHRRLGTYASQHCNVVIAINPARISSFVEALENSKTTVIEVATLSDARSALSQLVTPKDVVLYENDLPDLLEERRFL